MDSDTVYPWQVKISHSPTTRTTTRSRVQSTTTDSTKRGNQSTFDRFEQETSPTTESSVRDHPAPPSQKQDSNEDSTIPGDNSFSRLGELPGLNNQNTYSWKTLRDYYTITEDEHLPESSIRFGTVGMGSWCCIDSAAFVPQSRNRVYIVARLGDEPSRALLPFANRDRKTRPIRSEIPETTHRFWRYPAYTLQSRDYKGGAMQYLLEPTDPDWWSEDRDPTQSPSGEWWLLPEPECKGIIVNSGDEYNVRRLTPLECERLQGFPDNWTSRGTFPDGERDMSMSRRYQLLGNAVTAPVVTAIGVEIMKEMRA